MSSGEEKPQNTWMISLGPILLSVSWASTVCWSIEARNSTMIPLVSVMMVTFNPNKARGLEFFLGPLVICVLCLRKKP